MKELMHITTGSIDQYIQSVHSIPMLSLTEEQKLTRQWHIEQDANAAKILVMSHLRVVISVSRQYLGYGIAHADLIQEGNIGLMKAVKKFDPAFNVRLVTYATHWIKAEIHDYILKNWRIVKIATTKAQRKLFFKLRSLLPKEQRMLSLENAQAIANKLDVKRDEVLDMQMRFIHSDASLDNNQYEDNEFSSLAHNLVDERYEPSRELITKQQAQQYDKLYQVLEYLKLKDERMHTLLQKRWLNVEEEKVSLKYFAQLWNISIERVRQIEAKAILYIKEQIKNT
jgi:RNA polymerase sigma-32 factor